MDWTFKRSVDQAKVSITFSDADGESVMWVASPVSDRGVEETVVLKEMTVVTKDATVIKATLLRSCAEYDTFNNKLCVFMSDGFNGIAIWKNVIFSFLSTKKNGSPEEQKMIETFENIMKSVITVK